MSSVGYEKEWDDIAARVAAAVEASPQDAFVMLKELGDRIALSRRTIQQLAVEGAKVRAALIQAMQ